MNITAQQGPFKTSDITVDGTLVGRLSTIGRHCGWTVKALDGKRWEAGMRMDTNCKILRTRKLALDFIKATWGEK